MAISNIQFLNPTFYFTNTPVCVQEKLMILLFPQEVIFYKVIDYILHGKEDIKVIP